MFNSEKEIRELVDNFCKKFKINNNIFEVSTISKAEGGEKKRLYNNTKVINTNCTYVIKYYIKLKIFVIWTYSKDSKCAGMSFSLKTIRDKLAKGIMWGDKGEEQHPRNQYKVYFSYDADLIKLLSLVTNQI